MKEMGEGDQMKATKKVQIVEEKHDQAGVRATPRDRIWDWDYRTERLLCTALLIMAIGKKKNGVRVEFESDWTRFFKCTANIWKLLI